MHAGPFGGHKTLPATLGNFRRIATFPHLDERVEKWVRACWVCLRYRQQTTKIHAGFFVARFRLPFHHVLIDCEGRITPPDVDGSAYVLTYLCATTGAPLFEAMVSLQHSCLRRAFFRCAARAKTWPMLLGHDRGPELGNALMEEMRGLLNIDARLGTAWRPVDQAPVERVHRESQKEIGIFLHEVFKCAPGHWGGALAAR